MPSDPCLSGIATRSGCTDLLVEVRSLRFDKTSVRSRCGGLSHLDPLTYRLLARPAFKQKLLFPASYLDADQLPLAVLIAMDRWSSERAALIDFYRELASGDVEFQLKETTVKAH